MLYNSPFKPILQDSTSIAVDDTDPAMTVYYNGTTAGTATIQTTSTTVVLVDPINGTTTLTLTSYVTMGALQDKINSLTREADGSGWYCILVAAKRAWQTELSGTTNLLAASDSNARVTGGVTVYWDTSACGFRATAISMEHILVESDGSTMPALSKSSKNTMPLFRDPILGNTEANLDPWSYDYAQSFNGATYIATYGGSTTSRFAISANTQSLDGADFIPSFGIADATKEQVGTNVMVLPWFTQPGQRVVVQLSASDWTASNTSPSSVTSSTLSVTGWIGTIY